MNSPQFRYERIIWSPECGGCLMIQRKYWKDKKLSDWQNYASQEEGSYPVYDAKAKKAVKLVNRWRRAQELMRKAEKLRKLANLTLNDVTIFESFDNENLSKVEGFYCSEDPAYAEDEKQHEAKIIERYGNGDEWAWFIYRVKLIVDKVEGFTAEASFGCCSAESEADFKANYRNELLNQVLDKLNNQVWDLVELVRE